MSQLPFPATTPDLATLIAVWSRYSGGSSSQDGESIANRPLHIFSLWRTLAIVSRSKEHKSLYTVKKLSFKNSTRKIHVMRSRDIHTRICNVPEDKEDKEEYFIESLRALSHRGGFSSSSTHPSKPHKDHVSFQVAGMHNHPDRATAC